ncbi:MAG: DEAD/DEAH box helicase [Desulfobacterales bacterium]|nr:DEAD/DEAH box helicase [Desulfobacterales bacterium]
MPKKKNGLKEYIDSLKNSLKLKNTIKFHKVLPSEEASFLKPKFSWPSEIYDILKKMGINELYKHQAEAIDSIRLERHVVSSTPTASGKTLIYNIPVFEQILRNPLSTALFIFPLKALAQDQLRIFREMASYCSKFKPTAEIYDGDTPQFKRKEIRSNPPNVIFTNPEMLHLSFIAYHRSWYDFLSRLKIVVIDEVHTYRGFMGSHMAQVFRRLIRICNYYRAEPIFIFSSATIANPEELAEQLTGLNVVSIKESGAPKGKKHIVFIDPIQGASTAAIFLLKAALEKKLRTIVYTQSRILSELIAIWAKNDSGKFAKYISPYRAGLLPEERREIEKKLSNGEFLAVISTSALELGIDIGDLDLCILVGYPGTIMATWQRSGRVGRSGQESALILVAGDDALDKFLMKYPESFINREPEMAVINPYNPEILQQHILCAAHELPLSVYDPMFQEQRALNIAFELCKQGLMGYDFENDLFLSINKGPHINVDLRGIGGSFDIISSTTGVNKGTIDSYRAFRETHPGATYFHKGETYVVDNLNVAEKIVRISPTNVAYYTKAVANKTTEILETYEEKKVFSVDVAIGRLKVTDHVVGYEKFSMNKKLKLNHIPLELPPQIFETDGMWFKIPSKIQKIIESENLHFLGGIHAIEHSSIGIFPLLILTDRNDLSGISTTFHSQLKMAAIFIYDNIPGGAWLTRQAFKKAEELMELTLKIITGCDCELGCPSCVHSPRCGSGNRPIDKAAAIYALQEMIKVDKITEKIEPITKKKKKKSLNK